MGYIPSKFICDRCKKELKEHVVLKLESPTFTSYRGKSYFERIYCEKCSSIVLKILKEKLI